jgi:8-oxo-dGTP diphosphatase
VFVNARAIIQRDRDGAREVYLQYRAKPGEPRVLELPGGRIEEFESIGAALQREVYEETGLDVSVVEPTSAHRVTAATSSTEVECISVYAAYQTTKGPIDSIGFYFLCTAEGDEIGGDESERGSWFTLDHIAKLLNESPERLSWVDHGGLKVHLKACGHLG